MTPGGRSATAAITAMTSMAATRHREGVVQAGHAEVRPGGQE
ncbi:hypothetical protein [Nocardia sp. NPDC051981]